MVWRSCTHPNTLSPTSPSTPVQQTPSRASSTSTSTPKVQSPSQHWEGRPDADQIELILSEWKEIRELEPQFRAFCSLGKEYSSFSNFLKAFRRKLTTGNVPFAVDPLTKKTKEELAHTIHQQQDDIKCLRDAL